MLSGHLRTPIQAEFFLGLSCGIYLGSRWGGWGSLELACVLSGMCTPKPPSRSVSQSLSLGSLPGVGESSWGGVGWRTQHVGFFP